MYAGVPIIAPVRVSCTSNIPAAAACACASADGGRSRQHDRVGDVDVHVGHDAVAVVASAGSPRPGSRVAPWFDRSRSPCPDRSLAAMGPDLSPLAALSPAAGLLGHLAREPEVHDAHLVVAPDHDVVGLEVAVHQPLLVRRRQTPPRRHEHLQDLLPAARRAACSQ